jgi:hypothetical protein
MPPTDCLVMDSPLRSIGEEDRSGTCDYADTLNHAHAETTAATLTTVGRFRIIASRMTQAAFGHKTHFY